MHREGFAGARGGGRRGADGGTPRRDRVTRPRAPIGPVCIRGAGRCDAGKRAWSAITGRCRSSTGPWNAATRACMVDARLCDARTIAKTRTTGPFDSNLRYRDRETTGLARITSPCIDETPSRITITRPCITITRARIAITRACASIMGARITLPRPCEEPDRIFVFEA